MTLQINFKGLAYIYFFIITSFIISLFYFYPADKNEPYIYTEYDYILLESYSPQYLSYLNHFDNNWQTTNIDTILYNPDDKQYAVIRLKIPEHINAGNNLYIKTFKNNFDIYADTKYIKSNVPIEVESNYIRTPNVNIYTLNKIENLDYIYIYMQTNMPYYAGYITDLNIIEDENLSGVYKPYYVNFLMFVICFIYSTVFTIYVFITNSRTHNIDLRRISLTMLFFTLFLLTDSSAMFSYFTLIHWTAFNVIWISLIMGYYINTISILSNNTISTFLLKCISYCFSIPIVYTMFLDYNYIASYSVTFKYVLVFIIIALILASILMAISKPLASAQKITLCINLLFIVIFSIKFIEDTQLLNIHFSSIYSLIVLVFVIFSYSLLRNYMNKNKEKLKLMDLVLEKRFEINTIIDCVNDTISTDYDVVSLCEKLHKSVNKLALDKENISMYMYSLNNRRNTFKNLYKTDSMTYYRLEVEHFIENALKYPNGIYLVSNREELHFCVEHGDSSVLVILKCIPYFDDDDYEKLHLYLSSIKKTLENILIYSSSMGNQESVLEEISKIINEREKK